MLTPGTIYLAHDRFVCIDCAGATARHSHHTIGGAPVLPITAADVAAWPSYLGPLRCECSNLTATLAPSGDLHIRRRA